MSALVKKWVLEELVIQHNKAKGDLGMFFFWIFS